MPGSANGEVGAQFVKPGRPASNTRRGIVLCDHRLAVLARSMTGMTVMPDLARACRQLRFAGHAVEGQNGAGCLFRCGRLSGLMPDPFGALSAVTSGHRLLRCGMTLQHGLRHEVPETDGVPEHGARHKPKRAPRHRRCRGRADRPANKVCGRESRCHMNGANHPAYCAEMGRVPQYGGNAACAW